MNQILSTNNQNNNRDSNKNTNRNNLNDIKKIIMFFAVVILVFGIAIGGVYGYRLLTGKNKVISNPEISLQKAEEGAEEVIILAEAQEGISKIIYKWNDEEEVVKEFNGRTKQQEPIEIPYGENTLKVKLIDLNGKEDEATETFWREDPSEQVSDSIQINVSIVETEDGNKIKLVVTSEKPIEHVAYKWNDEEETVIEAQSEEETVIEAQSEEETVIEAQSEEETDTQDNEQIDTENDEQFTMEATIDVKRGNNKLTITAEDVEGNSNTIDKNFDGRLKPEFSVLKKENKIYMKISHDMGFKKIKFNVNGKTYTYDENFAGYDADKEEVEYYIDLKEGENTVIIEAISTEETEATYRGKCDYTAE